jgi:acetyl-CoA C-acetyltransferase
MDLEALIAGVSRDALRHAEVAARDVDGIWLGQLNGGFVPDIFCSSLVLQADPELRWCPRHAGRECLRVGGRGGVCGL